MLVGFGSSISSALHNAHLLIKVNISSVAPENSCSALLYARGLMRETRTSTLAVRCLHPSPTFSSISRVFVTGEAI